MLCGLNQQFHRANLSTDYYLPSSQTMTTRELLLDAAARAASYLENLDSRAVFPGEAALAGLDTLEAKLPEAGSSPENVLAELDEKCSPATVASAGQRYFGFVTGGSLPASLAGNVLAAAWDQNAAYRVMSPAAARLEDIALSWLADLLNIPSTAAGAIVSGATSANMTGLAAARRAVLLKQGWDVEKDGLFGAPPIKVVVGEEVHISLVKALGLLGLGRDRVIKVPVDNQGRMKADSLPPLDSATIVCIQAGNVNTGSFDPARAICLKAKESGAWVHVDGAFGLWAAASPDHAHLVDGYDLADSWATDAHKYLNVPYDSGVVFVKEAEHLRGAMAAGAAYLHPGEARESAHYGPEFSRRARGIEVWAALKSLGRSGVADLISRTCRFAGRFAEGFKEAGFEVLNDVVLNQVLVNFGDDETTKKVIAAVQAEGTCWAGASFWQGKSAMRVSVSSWATTAEDVEKSLEAIIRVSKEVKAQR